MVFLKTEEYSTEAELLSNKTYSQFKSVHLKLTSKCQAIQPMTFFKNISGIGHNLIQCNKCTDSNRLTFM